MLKKCRYCGKEFETQYKKQVFCSKKCRNNSTCNEKMIEYNNLAKAKGISIPEAIEYRKNNPICKHKISSIKDIVKLAEAEGLSYGQYVAKYNL